MSVLIKDKYVYTMLYNTYSLYYYKNESKMFPLISQRHHTFFWLFSYIYLFIYFFSWLKLRLTILVQTIFLQIAWCIILIFFVSLLDFFFLFHLMKSIMSGCVWCHSTVNLLTYHMSSKATQRQWTLLAHAKKKKKNGK